MGGLAFVFSGQGAQYPGMGKDLYDASPAAREIFDLAESLRPGTLSQCFSGTKEELSQTINTQPCLFAMDLACAAALAEAGVKAAAAAGFSLGEVAAAAFCGMMPAEDAFPGRLQTRGMDGRLRPGPSRLHGRHRQTDDGAGGSSLPGI